VYREQAGKWFISLLICLLILSCSHGDEPAEKNPADFYPLPPGMGAFTLRLADSAGRTIIPSSPVLSGLAVFNLKFEPTDAAPVAVTVDEDRTITGSAELAPVILAVGTYTLTVSAYHKAKTDENLAAQEEISITIKPGSDNTETVKLKPLLSGNGSNNGTFSWNVTINAGATAVNSAVMTIKDSTGQTQGAVENLLLANSGTRSLAPGIYTAVFNLEGKDKAAEWNELLYVYATLTSSFTYNFTEDHFFKTHWNITLDYDTNANAGDTYHDTIAIGTQSVLHGDSLDNLSPAPLLFPAKRGYRFDGWFTDQACTAEWNLNNPIHQDRRLWAGWTPNKYNLTLSFDAITDPMAGESFPAITISRGAEAPVTCTITVTGTYDSIFWEIDSVGNYPNISGTSSPITLDGATLSYNTLGGHVLKLEVKKDEKTWLKNIPFTVVE
jgi:uncharacterized repeat protein (TIGR02543 family)